MHRRTLLAVALLGAVGAGTAQAEKVALTAQEIESALAGNTVSGTWNGTAYKQYYRADGYTLYVPEGGRADEGKWRTDPITDSYDSWWSATGWTSYRVLREDATYCWVDDSGNEHPFVVLEGNRLDP